MHKLLSFLFAIAVLISCTSKEQEKQASTSKSAVQFTSFSPELKSDQASVGPDFKNYWFQGKAELTSFELEQARYGEIHKGHAVLIFVTEDFWSDKQVKYEFGQKTKAVVPVLKLNFTKKFNTGIYPYSLMTSSFTPIESPAPIKVTSSMQEWCGQAYMQINQDKKGYKGIYHSYFQSEGDAEFSLAKDAVFEDAIWAQIRKNPKKLPKGEFQAVPDLMYLRLMHKEAKAYQAEATLEKREESSFYSITYPKLNRVLKIEFNTKFPHEIQGWEETRKSGFGSGAKELTTRAKRKKTIMSPYWGLHGVADSVYRKQLELP